ncbi:MAG: sensor histidine kinase, partial [Verrucomicrobiae bacterium]|nr:sensor histidine kinase [Verrucomicrobiae bacterium]
EVRLRVSDHGPGVPASLRRDLFRPFRRTRRADAPAGLGLGLALVKELAHAQGASVRYEDAAGGGAAFVVSFPNARS